MAGGIKHDNGKSSMSLLPNDALVEISRVLDAGKNKYSAWNWAEGFEWSRLLDATYRHLGAWKEGEDLDPETGLSHAAHAACNLMFLITHQKRNLGTDDRKKWNG